MYPHIENYTITREIGTGGMAVVYEAVDNRLHRTVAIKVLHPHLCSEPTASDRFMREARAAATIDHPNVVRIYDFFSAGDLHYIIMEYVPGTSLEHILWERGKIDPESAVAIMYQIAEALVQAHGNGIIHRDIKPANILLHVQGRAMLSDFGLAHRLPDVRLTTDDAVAGTPSFMSPEQISGKAISSATDIYSWGVCLYAIVAGTLPYKTAAYPEVLAEISGGRVCPDAGLIGELPAWWHDILYRCLEPDPEKRIGDAAVLTGLLNEAEVARPPRIDPGLLQPQTSRPPVSPTREPVSSTAVIARPSVKKHPVATVSLFVAAVAAMAAAALYITLVNSGGKRMPAVPGKETAAAVFELVPGRPDIRDSIDRSPAPPVAPVKFSPDLPATSTAAVNQEKEKETGTQPTGQRISVTGMRPAPARDTASPAVLPEVPAPDSGGLFVACDPWAVVTIDGREIGTTPLAGPVALSAGAHTVRLANGFCEAVTDTVTVPADSILRKRYSLRVSR